MKAGPGSLVARLSPRADGLKVAETASFRKMQAKLVADNPWVRLVNADDLPKWPLSEDPAGVHYNKDGIMTLGRRIFEACHPTLTPTTPSTAK